MTQHLLKPFEHVCLLIALSKCYLSVCVQSSLQDPQPPWNHETCIAAASTGRREVLAWLRAQQPPCPWSAGCCTVVAMAGRSQQSPAAVSNAGMRSRLCKLQ